MSLHIRLNSKGGGGGGASSSGPTEGGGLSVAKSTGQNESVTVACPDHLILADLPIAKSLGVVTAASVRSVGRRSRRHLGERVHFCVSCDYPIAIYGRLSPCDHAFCLSCARSEPSCYICDERIQKITAIKLSEPIHICAAPHCLKSFTAKPEFLEHIHGKHANLLNSNAEKGSQNDNNAPKQTSADAQKQSLQPELSTARAPPPVSTFSPSSNSQSQDRGEDRNRLQSRDSQPPRPNNWFPPPPAGPSPYMQNTDQFSSDNNKPSHHHNMNNENSFSNFQSMQPMNYQMSQTSQFPYNNSSFPPENNMQQQAMGMMGVQFQQGMQMNSNQGGMMQGPYGNMMNTSNNSNSNQGAGAAGMGFFQGLTMGAAGLVVNKENEQQQQSGFGGIQGTQNSNSILQPPLPRQPPPAMPPPLLQQQQQQIDRGRDFPPGFGWNDHRPKTD